MLVWHTDSVPATGQVFKCLRGQGGQLLESGQYVGALAAAGAGGVSLSAPGAGGGLHPPAPGVGMVCVPKRAAVG